MLRRQLAGLSVATLTVSTLLCALSLGIAGPQDKQKGQQPEGEAAREKTNAAPPSPDRDAAKRETQITKILDEFDLKPHPLPSIPDDPPPHEGAMIDIPQVVEPPDLILVEVLEALPGRPISGERLVRPDGKIDIGFYGQVYVRGLTLEQVKVALIKHLRAYLSNEALGLEIPESAVEADRPGMPTSRSPFDLDKKPEDGATPRSSSSIAPLHQRLPRTGSARRRPIGNQVHVNAFRSRILRVSSQEQPAGASITIPVGTERNATLPLELVGQNAAKIENSQPQPFHPGDPNAFDIDEVKSKVVPPADSIAVFVDITAYNSKNYFILGDVQIPGKLPLTGNETVLDALQFAGGLMASAEPKDIRLVRPGRGGKPAKVYKVDLAAIQDRGDVTANYQLFPNDRLIVGRNEVVKKTVEIDRLNSPINSITRTILNDAFVLRYLQFVTTDNREELLKEIVDFWAKELSRPGGIKFDEETLRGALMRKTKLTPAPLQTAPLPR
jgi:protein involved in polysaccharide export with SLBB domain